PVTPTRRARPGTLIRRPRRGPGVESTLAGAASPQGGLPPAARSPAAGRAGWTRTGRAPRSPAAVLGPSRVPRWRLGWGKLRWHLGTIPVAPSFYARGPEGSRKSSCGAAGARAL